MSSETPTVGERASARSSRLRDDELPPRFEYVREIARGGMGRVLEVFDRELERTVALKLSLTADDDMRRRFAREVAITARLEHPSIVPVYDGGFAPNGEPFYIMRRVGGAALDDLVRAGRSLDDRLQLVPHVLQMADAIAHAHQRGIVHRDLKPTNVLVGELGETVVIDWGLAKRLDEADAALPANAAGQTVVGSVVGTPGFMAPEQAAGEPVDARSDVYALGASLYYVLSARLAAPGTETEMMSRTVTGAITPLVTVCPGVPVELAAITMKAMALEPSNRYLDAGGFAEELRRFLAGQLIAAHHYSTRERIARWMRRRRGLLVTIAASAVAVVAIASFALARVLDARTRAEHAFERERARADQLVVARARAYVASDPTRAAATLAELPASSAEWPAQRALVAEILGAGVAWGYPGHNIAATLAVSPSGRAISSGAGTVRVISLATHEVTTLIDSAPGDVRGAWVGDLVAVTGANDSIELFDPRSHAHVAIACPHPSTRLSTAPGLIAYSDANSVGVLVEVNQMVATVHTLPHPALSLVASPTGRYVIATGSSATTLHERRDGAWVEVATLPATEANPVFDASEAHVALETLDHAIVAFDMQGRETRRWQTTAFVDLGYAGSELYATMRTTAVVIYHCIEGGLLETRRLPLGLTTLLGANDLAAVLMSPSTIDIGFAGWTRTIHTPIDVSQLALDPTGHWLVAGAASRVLAWNLDRMRPDRIGVTEVLHIDYLDARTLVAAHHDRATRAMYVERAHLGTAGFEVTKIDRLAKVPDDAVYSFRSQDGVVAVVRAGQVDRILPANSKAGDVAVPAGPALFTGFADGTLRRDSAVVATLPSPIVSIAANGAWLAALSEHELWRSGPAGATTVAFSVGDGPVSITDTGVVVVSSGSQLYAWLPGGPVELVALTTEVVALHAGVNHTVVLSHLDGSLSQYDPATRHVRQLFATNGHANRARTAIATDGSIAAISTDDGLAGVDLATGSSWTISPHVDGRDFGIAPDGSAVVIAGIDALYRFRLDTPALGPAAMRDLTNAQLDAGRDAIAWKAAP